jgi:hypothetical protein
MSVTGKKGIGIPIILLHDAEGAIVTVELKVNNLDFYLLSLYLSPLLIIYLVIYFYAKKIIYPDL